MGWGSKGRFIEQKLKQSGHYYFLTGSMVHRTSIGIVRKVEVEISEEISVLGFANLKKGCLQNDCLYVCRHHGEKTTRPIYTHINWASVDAREGLLNK